MIKDLPGRIAVIIPCYKVIPHILAVLEAIPPTVEAIYIVDDACPDGSAAHVEAQSPDTRIKIIRHEVNLGVGGAMITGYRAAIADGMDILVKIDGDGQMDPELIEQFVAPILKGDADYTKGNRFFEFERVSAMPKVRLFGNAALSFMTKFSSGYWDIFDPTNGFTAIHAKVAKELPLDKLNRRFFFESDMLFRLNTLRAVVVDIPMTALYEDEVSNLKISRIAGSFLYKHIGNTLKRIFYSYYLRDFSVASLELPLGFFMLVFGALYGTLQWAHYAGLGLPAPGGTIMLTAVTMIMGLQLLLAFLAYDAGSVPKRPLHPRLHSPSQRGSS
ncbi:glycosyltransferase [Pseudohoeflea coraliihabitans]|uniref:Glycosyltransferase n=1 Tax=Pseudohoeflea coraliihabitans TaxID=2860393 RepID=A0ABS6WLP6_9HYPH|nr:glycosyltransferase [Pseudohoeflea sp. DP4N28-3]MBW3096878.1 glycosyltransferase [Pseudohoeflea sp. DP4N28-3]